MTLTWGAPVALWLLLGVLVWLADLVARTNFNPRQRLLQKTVRSLLLPAVALALARPVVSKPSSHQSIVYAVDVSDSVASHAIETRPRDRRAERGAAAVAHAYRHVRPGRRHARLDRGAPATRQNARAGADAGRTRRIVYGPRGALYAAQGERAEHVPRVVIFSDGHPTAGDTGSAVTHLAAERIPVSVEPLAPRSIGDAWIDSFDVPSATSGACSTRRSRSAVSAAVRARSSCG